MTTESLSQSLLEIAADATLLVGDMLTEAFLKGVSATEKGGFYDLVTEYDRKSEQIITDYIFQQHPDSTIVGEEGGSKGNGAVQWYVDPIDGTTNFSTGFPLFCVSIGAEFNGRIVAGVVYDPVRKELFSASTAGAFLNGNPIHVRTTKTEDHAVLLTDFPLPGVDTTPDAHLLHGQMSQRFRSVRRMGAAALELAYVACGRADLFLASTISPWDVAAGYLLVTQAGGYYLPLNNHNQAAPWLSPGCIAHGDGFEMEQSILSKFQ